MQTETPAKKDELYFEPKQLPKRENILCWPERLLKKGDFYFTKTCAEKRQADFENLQSQPRTPREKNDTANQNHRRPKRKPKTFKPISATG